MCYVWFSGDCCPNTFNGWSLFENDEKIYRCGRLQDFSITSPMVVARVGIIGEKTRLWLKKKICFGSLYEQQKFHRATRDMNKKKKKRFNRDFVKT